MEAKRRALPSPEEVVSGLNAKINAKFSAVRKRATVSLKVGELIFVCTY
jgi:hypothetical protein